MSILKYKNENGIWKKLYSREEINNLDNITYTPEIGKVWCDTNIPPFSASVLVHTIDGSTVDATKGTKHINFTRTIIQIPNPEAHGLPSGYTELDSITASNTQWINTNLSFPSAVNLGVELDISNITGSSTYPSLCGQHGIGSAFVLSVYNNTLYYSVTKSSYTSVGSYTPANRHTIYMDGNQVTLDGNKVAILMYSYNVQGFALFGSMETTSTVYQRERLTSMTLYHSKIWSDGTLVRDFIPCKNSQDEVGLYDLVSEAFFGNSGSGVFTAGNVIPTFITGYGYSGNLDEKGKWIISATKDGVENSKSVFVSKSRDYEINIPLILPKLFTAADFSASQTYNGTHSILSGTGDSNTDGFTIVGRCTSSAAKYTNELIRVFTLDITGYKYLKFKVRKDANHGICNVLILPAAADLTTLGYDTGYDAKQFVHYNDLATSWTEYSIDVSSLSGNKKIVFVGGYTDSTGNTTSSTSYSNIRLTID